MSYPPVNFPTPPAIRPAHRNSHRSGRTASPAPNARRPQPFRVFVQHVSPDPIPSEAEFYVEQLKANALKSWRRGSTNYHNTLRKDWRKQLSVAGMTAFAGLAFTAFRRLHRTVSLAFIIALLSEPISTLGRAMHQMERAYRQVRLGNPTEGQAMFKRALDDSLYSVAQGFLKPLYLGYALSIVLTLPKIMRAPSGPMQNVIHRLLATVGLKHTSAPVRAIDKIYAPVSNWGNTVSNRLRRRFPLLDHLES